MSVVGRFGLGLPDLEPRSFSFNSPFGACPECDGLGFKQQFAEELIIPNPELSINQGAIQAPGWKTLNDDSWRYSFLKQLSKITILFFRHTLEISFQRGSVDALAWRERHDSI